MADCQQFLHRIDDRHVVPARFQQASHDGDRHFFTTANKRGIDAVRALAQQGNPGAPESWKPFSYVHHFFWGLEDNVSVFLNMWDRVSTNRKVGALWPNDGDGNAWASGAGLPGPAAPIEPERPDLSTTTTTTQPIGDCGLGGSSDEGGG